MDFSFIGLIVVVFFGFLALACAVLVPVNRFLNREEKLSQHWTEEAIARRMAAPGSTEGSLES